MKHIYAHYGKHRPDIRHKNFMITYSHQQLQTFAINVKFNTFNICLNLNLKKYNKLEITNLHE